MAPQFKTPVARRVQAQSAVTPYTIASPSLRGGHAHSSPSLISPSVTMSTVTIPINDDAAERRQRRLDTRTHAAASPGCHTPTMSTTADSRRVTETGTHTFTNAQISEHYSMCVKLSAENKINAKNAFGLRLIDYMQEMLSKRGEMTNFQVAGCTIDASAKIYAGRVDSIYNDAHKVLGGLGRSDQPEQDGDDIEQEDGTREQRHGGRRRGKKATHTVQTIEKNLKSLDVNTFDLEFEVDPLFKRTCASFDEGGVQGLLLNQLHVGCDDCLLMLDSNMVPPTEGSVQRTHSPLPGLDQLRDYFKSIKNFDKLPITSTFADFKFNRSEDDEGHWDIGTLLSMEQSPTITRTDPRHQPAVNYTLMEQPQHELPGDYEDDDDDVGAPVDMAADLMVTAEGVETSSGVSVLGECGDGKVLDHVTRQEPHSYAQLAHTLPGELCLTDVLELSEYSYFNPNITSMWAGPQHWKLRPRNKETISNDGNAEKDEKAKKKKRQVRQPFRLDLTVIPDASHFKPGRGGSKLPKSVLTTNQVHKHTLPVDSHTSQQQLFSLFLRPNWKIKRQRKPAEPLEDHTGGAYYQYNNPNDSINYCPISEAPGGDSDEGEDIAPLPPVDWKGGGAEGVEPLGGSQFVDMLSDTQAVSQGLYPPDSQDSQEPGTLELMALTGANLVPMPKKVAQIQIDYARRAKRLDVKKLKTKMWEVMSEKLAAQDEGGMVKEGVATDTDAHVKFSELYSTVKSRSSDNMRKEMSVATSFVCLLHLANEKSLRISSLSDMSDCMVQLPA